MKKRRIRRDRVLILAGIVVLFIALIVGTVSLVKYLGKANFYKSHFYRGTTINGLDVSDQTVDDVKKIIRDGIVSYELTIVSKEGDEVVFYGKDFDLEPEWDGSIERAMEAQDGYSYRKKNKQPDAWTSETLISFDKAKLQAMLEEVSFMKPENQVQPVDAAISEYIENVGYTLIPCVVGNAIDEMAVLDAMEEAIYGLEEHIDLAEIGCYYEPEVYDDDPALQSWLGKLQQATSARITFQVDQVSVVLDADTYKDWMILDGENITFDEAEIKSYVAQLAKKFNTCYRARNFVTSYDNQVVTVGNSHYGWKVDQATEREQIFAELSAGTVVTRDLNYLMTANSHVEPDYGDSYVEINLTSQHLFLYKNGGLILETDFVSGDLSEGHGTPTGVFGITYLDTDTFLRGRDYESHVDWWMPFNGNIGMHDATWRSKFGAVIYMRNGSHGCINLPPENAKIIFDNVEPNYPVIVYELPGSESEAGLAQLKAYEVMDLIEAIGEVTLEAEPRIIAARQAYDALDSLGLFYMKKVPTKALKDAEAQLKELKKQYAIEHPGEEYPGNTETDEENPPEDSQTSEEDGLEAQYTDDEREDFIADSQS